MCGIAGVIEFDGSIVERTMLSRMTSRLTHRGPDGAGLFIDGCVGFGHRRLAIIDLTDAAAQPMSSPDQRYVISYNGEVYNYPELADELRANGWQFKSTSDTEVVLAAYATWGASSVKRLNGMFAFSIYDRKTKTVFLARDRYGIKPLYYSKFKNTFVFGSESKAFYEHPEFSARVDNAGLFEYFTFQNMLSERTLLEDVSLLPAASTMVIDCEKGKASEPERYWDYCFEEPGGKTNDKDLLAELDYLFDRAVNRQLVSDVEVGSYLSGGIDSGAISAVVAKAHPYSKTFTCGFDLTSASGIELNFDERRVAEQLSYALQTEQYEVVLKSGDMERVIPKLSYHLEEPRVGQSYPNYYIAGLASKFVKVVMSGVGGDEMFGGYPWRYFRGESPSSLEEMIDGYFGRWQRLVPDEKMMDLFSPNANRVDKVSVRDIFGGVLKAGVDTLKVPADFINGSMYFEARTFLQGLLMVEDKLSMAHSLETRVPFLDNELVDFASKLPVHLKVRNLTKVARLNENEPGMKVARYFQKTNDGKLLLRKMLEKYVPQEVIEREKQGFSAPDASWFKGESIDYVRRTLMGTDALIFDYLDRGTVHELVTEHLDGKVNRRLLIWSLLNFDHWLRHFIQGSELNSVLNPS